MASKYFAKYTKDEFNALVDRIYRDAYASGFRDGHLNGLALISAYTLEHVGDLAVSDTEGNIVPNFNHEVSRMQRKISDDRWKKDEEHIVRTLDNAIKEYAEKVLKKDPDTGEETDIL